MRSREFLIINMKQVLLAFSVIIGLIASSYLFNNISPYAGIGCLIITAIYTFYEIKQINKNEK